MNLDMGKMVMTSEDIFDTLKYGHIPIENLIEFAKTKKYDFSNFTYEDIEERYCYNSSFNLLWDGDAYYICCEIRKPNIEFDETYNITLAFYLSLVLNIEEQRNFPILPHIEETYNITSREAFVEALNNWEIFVQTSVGSILKHRTEILDELDQIIKNEKEVTTTDGTNIWYPMQHGNKKEYIKVLNQLPLELANNINRLINFQKYEKL